MHLKISTLRTVFFSLLPLFVLSSLQAVQRQDALPLESILNLFIQEHAATRLEWQMDMEIVTDPNDVPQGRFVGRAEQLKAFYTFRPITFAELSAEGRRSLYSDPRLLAWIEWFSGKKRLSPVIGQESEPQLRHTQLKPSDQPNQPDDYAASIAKELEAIEKKFLYTVPAAHVKTLQPLHLQLVNE